MMKAKLSLLLLPAIAAFAFFSTNTATSAEGGSLKILKFEADWCGPCQRMKPAFSQVSSSLKSKAQFVTVNIDSQPSLARQYGVSAVPTVIAIKNGKIVDRSTGYLSQSRLSGFVKKNL